MVFKPFKKKDESAGLTIEDLITLEHYEQARARLVAILEKRPSDMHSHLRLADVYLRLKDLDQAREQYLHVCEAYGRDGFYDRAVAVLAKVGRYFPDDHKITNMLAQLERAQRLEVVRGKARSAYLRTRDSAGRGSEAIEFVKVWESISRSSFADRFSAPEVVWWFAASATHKLKRGEMLAEQGGSDPRIFVLALGSLDARLGSGKKESTLRSFRVGDVVGEWALFEGKEWSADYVSPTGATFLVLDAASLEVPHKGQPISSSLRDRMAGQHHDLEIARAARHLKAK